MKTTNKHNILKAMAVPAAAAFFALPVMAHAEEPEAEVSTWEEPEIVEVAGAPETQATLTFDPNGGTMETDTVTVDSSNNQVVLDSPEFIPVKEDHAFSYWVDESGEAVTENVVTVENDMTLTAWWNVLLTFDWGEDQARVPFAPGETVDLSILQPPVNRPNFAGWIDANGDMAGSSYLVNLPETFYAAWLEEVETSDPFVDNGAQGAAAEAAWTAPVWTNYGTYAAYATNDGYVVINSTAGAGVDESMTIQANLEKAEIGEGVVKLPTAEGGNQTDTFTWKVVPADEKIDVEEPEAQIVSQSSLAWIAAAAASGLLIIGAAIYKKTRKD